jgi:hypothetical protein
MDKGSVVYVSVVSELQYHLFKDFKFSGMRVSKIWRFVVMKVLCAENCHSTDRFAHKAVNLTVRSLVECYAIRLLLFGRHAEVCRLSNILDALQVSP